MELLAEETSRSDLMVLTHSFNSPAISNSNVYRYIQVYIQCQDFNHATPLTDTSGS